MRHELASPAWLAAKRQVILDCLAACGPAGHDISGLSFSICEVSTDPPAHLGSPDARVGWHCRVRDGKLVAFEGREAVDVDYRMVSDYASMRQMGAFEINGDPERQAEYAAMTKALYEEGKIAIHGLMPRLPRPFAAWHDAVARQTL